MDSSPPVDNGYVSVVEIEIDSVKPGSAGFILQGRGADRADYRLEMHLDIPLDQRTRTVLGEMLAQSEWHVFRRANTPLDLKKTHRSRRPVS